MWSAKKTNVAKQNGEIQITVEFSNGTDTFSEVLRSKTVNDNFVSDYVKSRIEQLTKIDQLVTDLNTVTDIPVVTVTPVPKQEPVPTPEEVALSNYVYHLGRYKKLMSLVNLGILDSKDTSIEVEKTYCTTNYTIDMLDKLMV